jgi:UDP-N-acetylmuramyl tripeptide synthase
MASPAFAAKLAVARLSGAASRRAGRGGGTSLPGKLLLRLDRDALAELAGGLREGSVLVSATNGKTTTAAMTAAILRRAGRPFVHNRAGANLPSGVASALLADASPLGRPRSPLGLFEVDEAALEPVAEAVRPRCLLLMNLFRDQLDRYGELELIGRRWRRVVERHPEARMVLGADDPLVGDIGEGRREGTTFFGVEDTTVAAPLQHAADSKWCVRCGTPYAYSAAFVGHLGHYACPNCGHARPRPDIAAEAVHLDGMRGVRFTVRAAEGSAAVDLPIPGLYNVYNALAALALTRELGIPLADGAAALSEFRSAFGRVERIDTGHDGRSLVLLLVKNPAGANEVVRTLLLEEGPLPLLLALNDGIADGRDTSWIWDVDLEALAGRAAPITCSGTRAAELAVRLKYGGLDLDAVRAVEPDLERALDGALAALPAGGTLFCLPTYTALLAISRLVAERGWAQGYWDA